MDRCNKCGHFMGEKHYCSASRAIKGDKRTDDDEHIPDNMTRDKLIDRFRSLDNEAEMADKSTRARSRTRRISSRRM